MIAAQVLSISSMTRSYISDFGTCLPIGCVIAVAPEVAGERFLADHMFAGLHRVHDHRRMQIGRRADVDDIDTGVGDQFAKAAIASVGMSVPAGELDDLLAARRDGPTSTSTP